MKLPDVLSGLRGRKHKRIVSARTAVEEAAERLASGDEIENLELLEAQLVEASVSEDDFAKQVELRTERRKLLAIATSLEQRRSDAKAASLELTRFNAETERLREERKRQAEALELKRHTLDAKRVEAETATTRVVEISLGLGDAARVQRWRELRSAYSDREQLPGLRTRAAYLRGVIEQQTRSKDPHAWVAQDARTELTEIEQHIGRLEALLPAWEREHDELEEDLGFAGLVMRKG